MRDLRAKYGLTLEQVAQQVGVGKSTVRKWETGFIENMRRDKIAKLAMALHTTPDYLMGWSDTPTLTPHGTTPTTDLSNTELALVQDFRALNTEGQQKLLEYVADLQASGRYIKTASDNFLPKQA
ncbi:MAG: helix-turn-helix transcriptional regulator [Oscillospiraceae bacterium]|nr:helix-turn-helix transcriptional regulator [Oscillospiraceae bacterium]